MYQTDNLQLFSTIIYVVFIFASAIIAVMGSSFIISFMTRKSIDVREEIVRNRNVGIALVQGSFIWTIGRMCFESIKPVMNVWYSSYAEGFTLKLVLKFVFGILGALFLSLLIGALAVYLSMKVIFIITKDVNEWKEIRRGNTAVAIVISITVVVVGMFFESITSYIVMNVFDFMYR